MTYLDTHVVVWLYAGMLEKLPHEVLETIERDDLVISPMVMLELQYLKEIERITPEPALMCESLAGAIGLRMCDRPMLQVVTEAMSIGWTRDPFDRMIVAAAQAGNGKLLTKDETILTNSPIAVWG